MQRKGSLSAGEGFALGAQAAQHHRSTTKKISLNFTLIMNRTSPPPHTRTPPLRLAVWRGVMFEYPDTQAGQLVPPPPPRDLRFSSLCNYKYQTPYPLVSCAADFEMPLDNLGRYTVVSGLPQDKPSAATLAANSAVWVPALEETDASATPGLALFR